MSKHQKRISLAAATDQALCEKLERRALRSASLDNGVLNVLGTTGNDHMAVFVDANDATKIDVKLNGKVTTYDRASINSIYMEGRAGNDEMGIIETNGN